MAHTSERQANWFKRHWKWLVPVLFVIGLFIASLPKGFGNNVLQIAVGYSDKELCDKALKMAGTHDRVKETLGTLRPIGPLTILEGYVNYAPEMDSVFMAVTINGSKGKGKLDLLAFKEKTDWIFKSVAVRLKEPDFQKETISIFLRKNPNDSIHENR